jgi:hypothetical protein
MIRHQTVLAALAATLTFSASVALASTDVPAADGAQRLEVQERTQEHNRLRLNLKEAASEQLEMQRQVQRQLQERERIKALNAAGERHNDEPSRLQVMVQNRNQTQTQTQTQAHDLAQNQTRTQTRTRSMDGFMSGPGSFGRSGSGKH